jgi:cardiolipin synthase
MARIAPRVAIAAVVVGVFCTWLAAGDLTLNGIEGPNNGWLCVLLAGAAFLWTRMMERGSWVGVVGVLASALVIGWTAAANWHDARDVLDAGVSYGLLLVLVASAVLVAAAAVRAVSLLRDPARRARPATARGRARAAAGVVLLVLALFFVVVFQQVLGITQDPSWPPPPDAVTAAEAEAVTEAFVAREGVRPHDAALDFARSTAATIEPWVEGANFFPRIFADVEAARSSVHILMFGWREGDVGTRMAALLERKLREGVEVRVIVDRFGSRPYDEAQEMFEGLADAGAQIVVNDVLPVDRDGLFPDDRGFDWRQDEVGRADHRKLYVVDGAVAWTGGAGIEDHFENGGFHDVMVRVTGDVVLQAQAAFLTSFRGHGGPLSDDLARYFPAPADPGTTPVALAQVIPGGFVAAAQAIREQIDGARRRLDVMNPYLTDRDMLERILAAARRGVRVRLVVSETSNNAQATAALRHRYDDLLAAGVEIWELPGTVVHAKVIVADDVVSFGTVNLDSWALYRNSEIAMIARSADAAALFEERLFEPDIARSHPGRPPSGLGEAIESWLWDKLTYFL